MASKDYYEILGIGRDATQSEIKQAYRNLALQFHPDMVANKNKVKAEEQFKKISEAYQVLMTPSKRRMYDLTGSSGEDISQTFWGDAGFQWSDFTRFEDLGSILSFLMENLIARYFGNENSGSIFNELLTEAGIIHRKESKSTGKRGKTRKCKVCNGEGVVYKPLFNMLMIQTKCDSCDGTGRVPKEK